MRMKIMKFAARLPNHNLIGEVTLFPFDDAEARICPNLSVFHARIGAIAMHSRDGRGIPDEFLEAQMDQRGGPSDNGNERDANQEEAPRGNAGVVRNSLIVSQNH